MAKYHWLESPFPPRPSITFNLRILRRGGGKLPNKRPSFLSTFDRLELSDESGSTPNPAILYLKPVDEGGIRAGDQRSVQVK